MVGKRRRKLVVVVDDGGDAGLLEHDLGEPGAVGVVDVRARGARAHGFCTSS